MPKHRVLAALLALSVAPLTHAAQEWVQGKNYFPIEPAQHTSVPAGKVEVTEVFSYGCPACAQFNPYIQQLRRALPPNAQLTYVPAAFNPQEDWVMFQQAFCTAQVLGLVDRTHDAIYDAIWKSGELAVTDPRTKELKSPLPSIEDAARVYNKLTGVAVDKFVATAKSFTVSVKMKASDALVLAYHVDRTPTLVVNGKYRLNVESAGGPNQVIDLINYLVAKETK